MKFLMVPVELIRFVKFGIVGCSGIVIDFAVTFLLKEKLKANKYISNGTGFIVAASSNFVLNRYWTFASNDPNIGIQYMKFTLVSLVGLLVSNIIIFIGHDQFRLNFYITKIMSILIVVIWNFSANTFFTFHL